MECNLMIGYCDGKDRERIQRDLPTLTVAYVNVLAGDITILNVMQGERAEKLFKELTNL